MEIEWHGMACFSLKGKSATLVTDPYDSKVAGIKFPKVSAEIAAANGDFEFHHAVQQLGAAVKVFDWPGEYEAKNISVQAISAYDRPREKEEGKTDAANRVIVFAIEIDGFKICHLSNIGHKLTPEMLEMIGNVDILLVPVGGLGSQGLGCLDAKKAHEVIEQLEPRVVVPMYYKLPGVKLPLNDVSSFLKEVGLHAPVCEKSLKFQTPANLPQEQTEFKILEPVLG